MTRGTAAHVVGGVPRGGQGAFSDAGFVGRTHVLSKLLQILCVEAGLEPNGGHRREENL